MRTRYYCEKCDAYFSEEALPNINKKHFCGTAARIQYHDTVEDKGE